MKHGNRAAKPGLMWSRNKSGTEGDKRTEPARMLDSRKAKGGESMKAALEHLPDAWMIVPMMIVLIFKAFQEGMLARSKRINMEREIKPTETVRQATCKREMAMQSFDQFMRRLSYWATLAESITSLVAMILLFWLFLKVPRSDPAWFMVCLAILVVMAIRGKNVDR